MRHSKRRSISALSAIPGLSAIGLAASTHQPAELASQLTQYTECRSRVKSLGEALDEYNQALIALAKAAENVAVKVDAVGDVGKIGVWEKAALDNSIKDCKAVVKGCKGGAEVTQGVKAGVDNLLDDGRDAVKDQSSISTGGEKVLGEEKVEQMVRAWEDVEKQWRKRGKKEAKWGERMAKVDAEVRRTLGDVNEGLGGLVGSVIGDLGSVGACFTKEVDTKSWKGSRNSQGLDDGRISKTSSITVEYEEIETVRDTDLEVKVAGNSDRPTSEPPARLDDRVERRSSLRAPPSAPSLPIVPILQRRKAEYNFRGEPGELNFRIGDIIEVTETNESGWWTGRKGYRTGLFPSNYTRILTESEEREFVKKRECKGRYGPRHRHTRSRSAPESIFYLDR